MAPLLLSCAALLLALLLALLCGILPAGSDPFFMVLVVVVVVVLLGVQLRRKDGETERRVCVLVVGDIGRSPRMQYHALSLSKHLYHVTMVGFMESKPHSELTNQSRIRIVPIGQFRGIQGPKVVTYVSKVMVQFLKLFKVLMSIERQEVVVMQNPPGLPGMAVAWLVCVLRGSRLVIDWHNYGFTIMALSHGPTHLLVRVAERYERFFGRLASQHLCVTNAMKDDLRDNWGIKAKTLYDRPASIFRERELKTKHDVFYRLSRDYDVFKFPGPEEPEMECTIFSQYNPSNGSVTLRSDRPALLVSSTSWTEDEDFSILLSALQEYNDLVRGGASLPPVVCVITGKGPQKDHYRSIIDSLHLEHVKICTPWMEAEDYPIILSSADVGVCLHKSSSGLDLPMKVVDMFGCCLPVCAVHFNCISELVKHQENGLIFRDANELAQQLKCLLSDFPSSEGTLAAFRRNLRSSRGQTWDHNWDHNVLPLLTATR